jgi:DNA-binding FadR family transcriptional regulator
MTASVLHNAVLDRLGMEITSGEYGPGDVLTLEQLEHRFGVSRTVARETMRILESMNLVRSRRRVGIIVQPMAEWNVFDALVIRWRLDGPGRAAQLRTLTELRMAIEPMAAGAAARNAGRPDRERIIELSAQMREHGESGRLEAFLEVDIAFHTLLLRASHNEMFAALTDVVAEVLGGRTHHGLMPRHPVPVALDAHEHVAKCVRRGDVQGAEAAMHTLLTEVRDAVSDDFPA